MCVTCTHNIEFEVYHLLHAAQLLSYNLQWYYVGMDGKMTVSYRVRSVFVNFKKAFTCTLHNIKSNHRRKLLLCHASKGITRSLSFPNKKGIHKFSD